MPATSEPFYWHGELQHLLPLELDDRIVGYRFICPLCQRESFFNTGMGRRPEYLLFHDAEEKLCIVPVVECPYAACRFRADIRHGVAYDRKREWERE